MERRKKKILRREIVTSGTRPRTEDADTWVDTGSSRRGESALDGKVMGRETEIESRAIEA